MRFAGMALDGGKYVAAAKNAGGGMDSVLAKSSPDYSSLSTAAGKGRAQEKIGGMEAQAMLQNAGISSLANMQASAFGAQAIKAQGDASASATQAAGLSSMVGSIGGGLASAFKPKPNTTEFDLNKNFW